MDHLTSINEHRPPNLWVSRSQLSEYSGLCKDTITNICGEMKRAGRKKGLMLSPSGRVMRVNVAEFERFMAERWRWRK